MKPVSEIQFRIAKVLSRESLESAVRNTLIEVVGLLHQNSFLLPFIPPPLNIATCMRGVSHSTHVRHGT